MERPVRITPSSTQCGNHCTKLHKYSTTLKTGLTYLNPSTGILFTWAKTLGLLTQLMAYLMIYRRYLPMPVLSYRNEYKLTCKQDWLKTKKSWGIWYLWTSDAQRMLPLNT